MNMQLGLGGGNNRKGKLRCRLPIRITGCIIAYVVSVTLCREKSEENYSQRKICFSRLSLLLTYIHARAKQINPLIKEPLLATANRKKVFFVPFNVVFHFYIMITRLKQLKCCIQQM